MSEKHRGRPCNIDDICRSSATGENEPENRGTHLDVSHKPTFPGVGYREHVPYAETGPSSDVRYSLPINAHHKHSLKTARDVY